MTSQRWAAYSAIAGFVTAALVCLGTISPPRPAVERPDGGHAIAQPQQPVAAAAPAPVAPVGAAPVATEDGSYGQLRARLHWVLTRVGSAVMPTLDLRSRMLLAKSAARRARLDEVGLGFMDVYGIINAETSWVPRRGASKDGTPNLGIAQFEPATARALGLQDPDDPVAAVHAAALHMKEAAVWSASRLHGLKLGPAERAEKLREGVSIYYNLSSRGRAAWNGRNTGQLPRETRLHILNARIGAQEAALVEAQLRASRFQQQNTEAVLTAGDAATGG